MSYQLLGIPHPLQDEVVEAISGGAAEASGESNEVYPRHLIRPLLKAMDTPNEQLEEAVKSYRSALAPSENTDGELRFSEALKQGMDVAWELAGKGWIAGGHLRDALIFVDAEVRSIYESVMGAESVQATCESVAEGYFGETLAKHLSYLRWIAGQDKQAAEPSFLLSQVV